MPRSTGYELSVRIHSPEGFLRSSRLCPIAVRGRSENAAFGCTFQLHINWEQSWASAMLDQNRLIVPTPWTTGPNGLVCSSCVSPFSTTSGWRCNWHSKPLPENWWQGPHSKLRLGQAYVNGITSQKWTPVTQCPGAVQISMEEQLPASN